jgi:hypothetical protein
MISYKIKANNAWALAKGPFELWRISRKTGEKERVEKSEIAALKDRLDELLYWANAKKTDQTRKDLFIALSLAGYGAPKNKVGLLKRGFEKQLERSISKVVGLLAELPRHISSEISIQIHQMGAGIIDASPLPLTPPDAGDPSAVLQITASDLVKRLKARADSAEHHGDRKLLKEAANEIERLHKAAVIIRMPELLKAWLECAKKMPWRRRGQPPKWRERTIVREAALFAFRHSTSDPSGDNFFRDFVLQFYKCVTDTDAKTDLTGLIKEVLAEVRNGLEVNRPKQPR